MADDRGAFNLEVGVFPLQRVVFASQTNYQYGTLGIHRTAFLNAIAEPRAINPRGSRGARLMNSS